MTEKNAAAAKPKTTAKPKLTRKDPDFDPFDIEETTPVEPEEPDDELEDEEPEDDELDDTDLDEPTPVSEPKTVDPKASAKRSRRTKAEIEAEAIEDAKTLLKAAGYVVSDVTAPEPVSGFLPERLPVDAHSNDIVGSLKTNAAGVAVLNLSVRRWVGEPPFIVQAAQLDDVINVLTSLRSQSLSKTEA